MKLKETSMKMFEFLDNIDTLVISITDENFTSNYRHEYSFDTVEYERGKIICKGKEMKIAIPETKTYITLSFVAKNQVVIIYDMGNYDYANGGVFTFEGELTVEIGEQ